MKRTFLVVVAVAAACGVGCRTPQTSQRPELKPVVARVLDEHHFAPPTFVDGTNALTWAIAARPRSNHAVDVARVKVRPNGRASVEIINYHFGPSDWAILGRLFTQGRPARETLEIEQAIQNRVAR